MFLLWVICGTLFIVFLGALWWLYKDKFPMKLEVELNAKAIPKMLVDPVVELRKTPHPESEIASSPTLPALVQGASTKEAETDEVELPVVRETLTSEALNDLSMMVSQFPPLPTNTTRILIEIRSPKVNQRRLVSLVAQDPILSAAVLRMANSAFAAQASEVTSIEQATLLLGNDSIVAVALCGAMGGLRSKASAGGFNANALLQHNVATGLFAAALARRVPPVRPEEAMTAGLLHDLGKIILNVTRPDVVRKILDVETTRLGESRLAKEERYLGGTHAVVGAMLASRWNLPETLVLSIELHHHPALTSSEAYTPRVRELTAMVFIANQLAKIYGCHGDDREIDLPAEDLLTSLGFPDDYDELLALILPEQESSLKAFLDDTAA